MTQHCRAVSHLDEVAGDVTASNVKTLCQVRKSKAFVHRHNVGDTITRVDDDTSEQTYGVCQPDRQRYLVVP